MKHPTVNMSQQTDGVETEEAQYHFKQFMEALGIDPEGDEHLEETPERVARSRRDELFVGLDEDPDRHLEKTFEDVEQYEGDEGQYTGDAGWVIVDNIQVESMCAHHFLPFRGVAHVGYIPQDRVAGLSKLARVTEGYARRPQVQERLTNQVADAVHDNLDPLATMIVLNSEHLCMSCRGIQEPHSSTSTAAIRGKVREDDSMKQEFYQLLRASQDGRV